MLRHLDGPRQEWSTKTQSAAFLGLTEDEFETEVSRFPDVLTPNTRNKAHKWYWLDLIYYSRHITKMGLEKDKEKK